MRLKDSEIEKNLSLYGYNHQQGGRQRARFPAFRLPLQSLRNCQRKSSATAALPLPALKAAPKSCLTSWPPTLRTATDFFSETQDNLTNLIFGDARRIHF